MNEEEIEDYIRNTFFSREIAESAMHDFSTLRRRINKWKRGTSDAHSIFNLVLSIENRFEKKFIEHLMRTRFNREEREIYYSCLRKKGENVHEHFSVKFSENLEKDIWKARNR